MFPVPQMTATGFSLPSENLEISFETVRCLLMCTLKSCRARLRPNSCQSVSLMVFMCLAMVLSNVPCSS